MKRKYYYLSFCNQCGTVAYRTKREAVLDDGPIERWRRVEAGERAKRYIAINHDDGHYPTFERKKDAQLSDCVELVGVVPA